MFAEIVLDAARKEMERIDQRMAVLNAERDKDNSPQIAWQLRAEIESLDERKGEVEHIQRIALNLD